MHIQQTFKLISLSVLLLICGSIHGQSLKQEKMKQLSFLVGEWVGTSSSFENGVKTSEVPAFEKISYDLDKHILVVELNSTSLQLHTIIYYDEVDSTYYYNPFSKRGARKLPAEFSNGQLIVSSGSDTRFIFHCPTKDQFQEYGERRINGEWVKYFEDNFKNVE